MGAAPTALRLWGPGRGTGLGSPGASSSGDSHQVMASCSLEIPQQGGARLSAASGVLGRLADISVCNDAAAWLMAAGTPEADTPRALTAADRDARTGGGGGEAE